jgi:hypothetical protein
MSRQSKFQIVAIILSVQLLYSYGPFVPLTTIQFQLENEPEHTVDLIVAHEIMFFFLFWFISILFCFVFGLG